MNNKHQTVLLASAVLSVALLQGCATNIKASSTANPPPAQAFSAYSRIEVKPVVFKEGYQGDHAGLVALLVARHAGWQDRPRGGQFGRDEALQPLGEVCREHRHGRRQSHCQTQQGAGVRRNLTWQSYRSNARTRSAYCRLLRNWTPPLSSSTCPPDSCVRTVRIRSTATITER